MIRPVISETHDITDWQPGSDALDHSCRKFNLLRIVGTLCILRLAA
ncbi:MAG: hypothetical protein MI923_22735 [Phycisphaerales bacterium]|nr:hypothetical protein [Phycisphaerales bacterium]